MAPLVLVVARLLEVARTIPAMEAWARALRPPGNPSAGMTG